MIPLQARKGVRKPRRASKMVEEAPLSATTDRMLKSMLKSRKWGPPLQALLPWLFETTTEGEEDVETGSGFGCFCRRGY